MLEPPGAGVPVVSHPAWVLEVKLSPLPEQHVLLTSES